MVLVMHWLGRVFDHRETQIAASPSDHAPNSYWIQDFRFLAWVFGALLFSILGGWQIAHDPLFPYHV